MSKRVACAFIPNFSIEVVLRKDQSLAPQAVALTDSEDRIVTFNTRAAKAGVRMQMTSAQARSLCQNLVIMVRSDEMERKVSNAMTRTLQQVGPIVEEEAPGTYYLDPSGLLLLYKSERGLAKKIIESIRLKLYPAKVGIAGNKFLAKVAAETSKPSGFTVVTAGTEKKFIKNLSVDFLDLSEDVSDKLRDLGINTIGKAADFNPNDISLRFGNAGRDISLKSRNYDPEPVSAERQKEPISRKISLTYSIHAMDEIGTYAVSLIERLFDRFRKSCLATDRIKIILHLDDSTERSFMIRLDKPTSDIRKFSRQLRSKLENLEISSGVNEIEVIIPRTVANYSEQLDFAETSGYKKADVFSAGNLVNVPDSHKLCLPELKSSFLPERNFKLFPISLSGDRPNSSHNGNRWRHPYSLNLISGMRLLQPPREIKVITEQGEPKSIVLDRSTNTISRKQGPWQISGGWWEEGFDRLYYEVEITGKKLFLMYYDRLSGRWFIHGIFD